MTRLRLLFKAIVAGVSACSTDDQTMVDASQPDVISPVDASVEQALYVDAAVEDAPPLDSYVVWCDAGPPQLVYDGGCYEYEYVPCGLPPGDTVTEAGAVSRCDQICATADDCALVPGSLTAQLYEAGILDADTTGNLLDGGAVMVLCACITSGGRVPAGVRLARVARGNVVGAYFAGTAQLERASIVAFHRLRGELDSLGASRNLLAGAERAMRDEARHARIMTGLASRFGCAPDMPAYRPAGRRSVERIARENAVEGCVRETFGALVATWQATHARDEAVRAAMARVAADETRHAELSWAVDRFLDRKLDAPARERTARARRQALDELERGARRGVDPLLVERAGLPTPTAARRLVRALAQTASLYPKP